jgi:peptidoglycan/LPS O-acetylase OafA/YrhL
MFHHTVGTTAAAEYALGGFPLAIAMHSNTMLFFAMSGFLFFTSEKTLNFKHFYKDKALRILVPFFVWNLIYFFTTQYFYNRPFSFEGFHYIFTQVQEAHLWYLRYMVSVVIFAPFIKRMLDALTARQVTGLMFISVIIFMLPRDIVLVYPKFVLLFNQGILGEWFPYLLMGYLVAKHTFGKKLTAAVYTAGIAAAIFLFTITTLRLAGVIAQSFRSFWTPAFFLSTAIFLFAKKHLNIPVRPIKFLANLTFGAYLVHFIFLKLFTRFVPLHRAIVWSYTELIFVAVSSFVFAFIIKKIKFLRAIV